MTISNEESCKEFDQRLDNLYAGKEDVDLSDVLELLNGMKNDGSMIISEVETLK